jgi:hypothetical protein
VAGFPTRQPEFDPRSYVICDEQIDTRTVLSLANSYSANCFTSISLPTNDAPLNNQLNVVIRRVSLEAWMYVCGF